MCTKKLHIKSFGCQMNKLDSALVTSALEEAGFTLTEKAVDADVILINTCSVREHAEQRVWSHLGHLKGVRKSRPEIIVGVIGCMAQRVSKELIAHPAVDIVAGPAQIPQIPDLVARALQNKTKQISTTKDIRQKNCDEHTGQVQSLDKFELDYRSDANYIPGQAFVRVMRGCNNFCSYCVVPYVRGPEVSRPIHEVIEQIKKLAGRGIKQITLLGQTISRYEYTAGEKTWHLADLLEMANDVEGLKWIRFITSHPVRFDESILHTMANLDKVCPYLHIPAQSGSDRILKAMRRGYTAGEYLDLLDRARRIVPDIAIAGDFIVGFPGETDEDFDATVALVKRARYKNIFAFKYSPRPGTTADKQLADTVSDETKRQRNIELLAVQEEISAELSGLFIGKTVEVLVEGLSKKPHLNRAQNRDLPQLIGRTAEDWIVVFNGPQTLAGQFAKVKITKTSPLTLFGKFEEVALRIS